MFVYTIAYILSAKNVLHVVSKQDTSWFITVHSSVKALRG